MRGLYGQEHRAKAKIFSREWKKGQRGKGGSGGGRKKEGVAPFCRGKNQARKGGAWH